MDLAYGEEYETFREEVRAFLAEHGKEAPPQLSRGKSDAQSRAWQQLLIDHGYAARTIPKGVRRLRRRPGRPEVPHHRRGVREGAGARRPHRRRPAGPHAARTRHPGAEARLYPADDPGRDALVPRLFGTQLRFRPRIAFHESGTRRRRLRHQRPEDLDLRRATRRHDVLPRSDRAGCSKAPRHQLPAVLHGYAGHRGATACDDDRRGHLQRSLLHRRARPPRARSSDAAAKAGTWRTSR